MLVMTLNSGDVIDLGGLGTIRVTLDPERRSRIRLSIDAKIVPITRIKRQDVSNTGYVAAPLVVSTTSVYKPEK